jgi:hypothetical protein
MPDGSTNGAVSWTMTFPPETGREIEGKNPLLKVGGVIDASDRQQIAQRDWKDPCDLPADGALAPPTRPARRAGRPRQRTRVRFLRLAILATAALLSAGCIVSVGVTNSPPTPDQCGPGRTPC